LNNYDQLNMLLVKQIYSVEYEIIVGKQEECTHLDIRLNI
jgi:hypothetical protein